MIKVEAEDIIILDEIEEPKLIHCCRCGRDNQVASASDDWLCADCAHMESTRLSRLSQNNTDWLAIADQAGIELWQKQPAETAWEYAVWSAYRDMYPAARPQYRDAARTCNTSTAVAKRLSMKWSWAARMNKWIEHVDAEMLLDKKNLIIDMNNKHVTLASKMADKISKALEALDPAFMKPNEITQMVKAMTEMERKAKADLVDVEEQKLSIVKPNTAAGLKKTEVKTSDLGEIVGVLAQAGVLGDITRIGVKQTDSSGVSTELVAETSEKEEKEYEENFEQC